MSEPVATDAGTGEPLADEPEVNSAGAPIVRDSAAPKKAPVETKTPEAEPKRARTSDDDLEDLLKKSGGLKYKAGGKEKTVTTVADLRRMMSRVDGTDTAASEALKARQEADGIRESLASIAKLPPRDRIQALRKAGVDPALIREAVEESILAEDEQQKAQSHLSPREREYEQKLREREEELTQLRQRDEDARARSEEEAYVARVNQTGERLTKATVAALQKAKISGEHAPRFLQAIAERLDRNERLGLELDEDELADVVMREHEGMADSYYSSLDLQALAEKLELQQVDDPSKPGKKTSRLKLLMLHEAAKIRAQRDGGQSPVRVSALPQAQNGKQQTLAEAMDAMRTFGGGRR